MNSQQKGKNSQQKGKNFEKKAYFFLKDKFDRVIWCSKINAKAPIDFECYNKKKKIMIEDKSEKYLCIKSSKKIDFFITQVNNEIKLIPFNEGINSDFANKIISITKEQELYIKTNFINLSRFVQTKLQESMKVKNEK